MAELEKTGKSNRIFFLGDIHGSFKPIRAFAQRYANELSQSNNVIIQLGDFGANYFFDIRDIDFKVELGNYPFTYFVIRGNHEERPSICATERDPLHWHLEMFYHNWVYVENDYPYIKYALDDPSIYRIEYTDIEGNPAVANTLIIPGAYSADKMHRIAHHWSWFKDEQLTEKEMKEGLQMIREEGTIFDLILSHTCPLSFEPIDLFLPQINQSTVDNSMEIYLERIHDIVNYKAWLWGHFHAFRDYPRSISVPSYKEPRNAMLFNDALVDINNVFNDEYYLTKYNIQEE